MVIAAIAFRGMLLSSFEEVTSDGVQSAVPPLIGTNARASTVNSTSPEAGAVKLTPDETNTPTRGLLAGTTRVYFAQFAFTGLPVGQFVFASAEIDPVVSTSNLHAYCKSWPKHNREGATSARKCGTGAPFLMSETAKDRSPSCAQRTTSFMTSTITLVLRL